MKSVALSAFAGLAIAATASAGTPIGSFGGGAIPDAVTSHTNPGVLTLTGTVVGGGNIQNLGVAIDLTHTWVGDLEMEITSPMGTTVNLVHRAGATTATSFGDSSEFDGEYTFRDGGADFWAAAAAAPFGGVVATGTYAATGQFNVPSALSAMNGESANGTWTLVVRDWGGGDLGTINGWTLLNVPAPGAVAAFGLAGVAGLRRRR